MNTEELPAEFGTLKAKIDSFKNNILFLIFQKKALVTLYVSNLSSSLRSSF